MNLVEYEYRLFNQLMDNRKPASVQYIPASMKDEFMDSIFSSQVLSEIAKDIYYNSRIGQDSKQVFLQHAIGASMYSNKFWSRLIMENVNPTQVAEKMLENTRIF